MKIPVWRKAFNTKRIASLFSALLITTIMTHTPSLLADGMPLDDPWIVFCLINVPTEEVGDCIDGLPHGAGDILKASGVQLRPKLSFEVVKIDKTESPRIDTLIAPAGDPKQMSVPFYCPNEFGPGCSDVERAFIAVGGKCKRVDHNTVCYYP